MIHFVFSKLDRRYLFLKFDNNLDYLIIKENLMPIINQVDPICHLKTFKGDPFKQEFLFEYTQKGGSIIFYAPIGMWYPIWKYFKDNNIEFDGLDQSMFKNELGISLEQFKDIVNSWGLSITPRPYQYEAAYKVLQYKLSLSELATRAGKTLIAYMIFRYGMEYMGVKKILMIVPGIDLVLQGFNDFKDYKEFFKSECIWSGGKVVESSNLTIATYQSLINFLDPENKKYNPSFFNGYDMVFIDEAHQAKSPSIKKIISQPFMKTVKNVFGMTGTLPKPFTIESYCLHSLLGPKIQTIKASQLIDGGYISPVQITQHRVHYKDKIKQLKTWIKCAEYSLSDFIEIPDKKNPNKLVKIPLDNPEFLIAYKKEFPFVLKKAKQSIFANGETEDALLRYKKLLQTAISDSPKAQMLHTEVMMVHFFEERINYLIDLLVDCPNNTLILAQHTEYIKYIGEKLKEAFPDRPIVTVYGASKDRKTAKTVFKENNNAIMVANYAIMGTGITLSNLCYGVLFESFKSDSRNRQSIGRGLGLSEMKTHYVLHDITDCFDQKYSSNKLLLHGKERIKIYDEQRFPYKIINVTI